MNTNMTIPRAVLFVAWGDPFITEVLECIAGSRMPACPVYLLTDESSTVPEDAPFEVIRASFELDGKLRKAELLQHLPDEVETTFDAVVHFVQGGSGTGVHVGSLGARFDSISFSDFSAK